MSRLLQSTLVLVLCFGATTSIQAFQIPGPAFPKTIDGAIELGGSRNQLTPASRVGYKRNRIRSQASPRVAPSPGNAFQRNARLMPKMEQPLGVQNQFGNSNVYRKPPVKVDRPAELDNLGPKSILEELPRTPDANRRGPDLQSPSNPASSYPNQTRSEPFGTSRRDSVVEKLSDAPLLTMATPATNEQRPMVALNADGFPSQAKEPSGLNLNGQYVAREGDDRSDKNQSERLEAAGNSMQVRVVAPELMLASQPNELVIEVLNLGTTASTPVEVRVSIPEELTITRFDRDAWLDDEQRVITFSIRSIPGRYKQAIRMRGVSHHTGQHQLQVAIVAGDNLIDQSALAFGVVSENSLLRNAKVNPANEDQYRLQNQLNR